MGDGKHWMPLPRSPAPTPPQECLPWDPPPLLLSRKAETSGICTKAEFSANLYNTLLQLPLCLHPDVVVLEVLHFLLYSGMTLSLSSRR